MSIITLVPQKRYSHAEDVRHSLVNTPTFWGLFKNYDIKDATPGGVVNKDSLWYKFTNRFNIVEKPVTIYLNRTEINKDNLFPNIDALYTISTTTPDKVVISMPNASSSSSSAAAPAITSSAASAAAETPVESAAGRYAASSSVASAAATTATSSVYKPVTTVVVLGHGAVHVFEPPRLYATSTTTGVRRLIKTEQLPFDKYSTGECVLDSVVLCTGVIGGVVSGYEGTMVARLLQEIAIYENTNGRSLTDKLKEIFPPLNVDSEGIATPAVDGGVAASNVYKDCPLFVAVKGETLKESVELIDTVQSAESREYKGSILAGVCATGIVPKEVNRILVGGVSYIQAFNISVYKPSKVMTGKEFDNSFNPYTLQWSISGKNANDTPSSAKYIGARFGTSFTYKTEEKLIKGELNGPPDGALLYMPKGETLSEHTQIVMTTCRSLRISGRIRLIFIACGAYSGGVDRPLTPLETNILYKHAFQIFTCSRRLNIITYNSDYYYILYDLLVHEITRRIKAGGKRKRRRINGRRTTRKRIANKRTHTRRRR
jgi:hypothetical protein